MKRMPNWLRGLWVLAVLVTVGLTSLASCGIEETDMPFKTVAQGDKFWTAQEYSEVDPDLLIITSIEEVNAPGMNIEFGSELTEKLRAVAYNDSIVIVVFRGQLGGTNPSYNIDVLTVTHSGNRVRILTHFGELGPEEGALMALSSPYHIIAVSKKGLQGKEVRFILEEDGETVKKRSHFIP